MKRNRKSPNHQRSRIVFVCVALTVMAMAIPHAAGAMTLTHWDWHLPRAELIMEWAEKYTREVRPDIHIETSIFSWDEYWDKLPVSIATGVPPDFMQFHNEKYSGLEGMLAPYPEDLFPHAEMAENYFLFREAFLLNGRMYFFPAGIMTAGIFYNVDLLEQAGMTEPASSWAEIIDQAKKLTHTQDDRMTQAGLQIIPAAPWVFTDLVYQQGGLLFSDQGASFLSEEATEAVNLLMTIYEAGVGPGGHIESPGQFETGQVAMRYEWTWFHGPMQDHQDTINFKVAQLPTFTGESRPARGRNNYEAGLAVPYNVPAERQQEAFQFIRWLYDQDEFYVELNRLLGRIPGRPALWDAPELVEDSAFQMLAQQAVFTVYPGPLPSWYFGIGEEAWNKILFDGVAPSVAFQQAQVEANARWVEEPAEFLVENTYQAP